MRPASLLFLLLWIPAGRGIRNGSNQRSFNRTAFRLPRGPTPSLSLFCRDSSSVSADDEDVLNKSGLFKWIKAKSKLVSNRKNSRANSGSLQPIHQAQKKFEESVTSVTGKQYEFGDLTRWLDKQAKSTVSRGRRTPFFPPAGSQRKDWLSQQVSEAEAGTISEDPDSSRKNGIGSLVVHFFRFLRSFLLVQVIKLIVVLEIETPVLRRLPIRVLVDILNVCLEGGTRPKVVRVVGTELDKRLKRAVTGDENYQFGDLTKRAVSQFTDKDSYQFGDITRSILVKAKAQTSKLSLQQQLDEELNALESNVNSMEKSAGRRFQLPPLFRHFR